MLKQKETLKVAFATPQGKPKVLGPSWSKKTDSTPYTPSAVEQRTLDSLNHHSDEEDNMNDRE